MILSQVLEPTMPKHDSYKIKGKAMVSEDDAPVTIMLRHHMAGLTKPVTPLECGTI